MRILNLIVFLFGTFMFIDIGAQDWSEYQKITTSDRSNRDRLGWAGAAIEGDVIAFGSFTNTDSTGSNSLTDAGAVYIYFQNDSTGLWEEHQKIVPSDRRAQDFFGYNVKFYNGLLAVYSWNGWDTTNTILEQYAGSVYLFERQGNYWVEKQKLIHKDRYAWDFFGGSPKLIGVSGNQILVPCTSQDRDSNRLNGVPDAGAIYVFERNLQGKYLQKQKITPGNRDSIDSFGNLVVHGDLMLVGSAGEAYDANQSNYLQRAGAAYVYERNASGRWMQKQKLFPSTRRADALFGAAVGMIDSLLIIGAYGDGYDSTNSNYVFSAGAAYIFKKNSAGTWVQHQKISNNERSYGNSMGNVFFVQDSSIFFGCSNCDKDSAGNSVTDAGALIEFKIDNNGYAREVGTYTHSKRKFKDWFGTGDGSDGGNYVVVSSPTQDYDFENKNYKEDAGAIYVFSKCPPKINFDTLNICKGDSVFLNGEYRFNEGLYIDSFSSRFGCDSMRYMVVDVDTVPNLNISLSDSLLVADSTYESYQWIDCNTGLPSPGDTSNLFWPTQDGLYAVEVTFNGCTDRSDCFDVNWLGIQKNNGQSEFILYPNPATDHLYIKSTGKTLDIEGYRILDVSGRQVQRSSGTVSNEDAIDISQLKSGSYFLELNLEGNQPERFRFTVE